jgi:hypothetical protein
VFVPLVVSAAGLPCNSVLNNAMTDTTSNESPIVPIDGAALISARRSVWATDVL